MTVLRILLALALITFGMALNFAMRLPRTQADLDTAHALFTASGVLLALHLLLRFGSDIWGWLVRL